jgi:APA family basic amino acid/polyamine antiporter
MMLVSGSRIIFGMARDGSFPSVFGSVHRLRRTPWVASLIVMILVITAIVLTSGNIIIVASLSVFGIFIVFAFVNLSVIWLRFKQPDMNRAFKSPFRIRGFPVLAGLGLFTVTLMKIQFDMVIKISGLVLIAIILLLSIVLSQLRKES